ncbi:IS1 family transposase [Sorangium sp. KYC3313]|uniref:IS1 family transposase n=1 Tax=Sorangium sp. KYC3313 TaxID=3449740 RepID=UPI003F8B937C
MANVLPAEKRLAVLAALVDGNSERAVSRMTDVSRAAISRFGLALGAGAQRLHDRLVRGLRCELIQADEVFSYVGKKQARVTEKDAPGIGETYSFTALDTASRLVIAWRVGKRDMETCGPFIADLRSRLLVMPQITTDGFAPYIATVAEHFGLSVDYMQTVKNYRTGSYRGPDHRYEPPRDPFITKHTIYGAPDAKKASTAYVERLNGTTRHLLGRMRRLCYAFSKAPEHHRAAVALHYTYFNLCWTVRTLRVTPAMEAGLTGHVWDLEELLDAIMSEPAGEKPEPQPLEHRQPEAPSRPLPGGRGFLRLVTAPTPALRRPTVQPDPPPLAPVTPAHDAPPPGPVQLDLLSWRPKPRAPEQLSLFPEPPPE